MKKLLLLLLLLPQLTLAAFTAPWNATSTSQGWISPTRINGVEQTPAATIYVATSTTASSTLPRLTVTLGERLNDNAKIVFGTSPAVDGALYSDGTNLKLQPTSATNNSIQFGSMSIGATVPYLHFNNIAGTGLGVISRALYVQDINQIDDGFIAVPAASFPSDNNYLYLTFNSAAREGLIQTISVFDFPDLRIAPSGALLLNPQLGATTVNSDLIVNLNTYLQQASSTLLSSLNGLYVGTTATTTIKGDLATSTFSSFISAVSASTTATSTMKGINLPYGGCFAIAGTCVGGSGGSGTVTSVAMTVPTFLSVAGSPITTSGTLAVTLSGTALPLANGGTNATSFSPSNSLVYYDGTRLVSTSTNPLYVSALTATSTTIASSFQNFTGVKATTTSATSTSLFAGILTANQLAAGGTASTTIGTDGVIAVVSAAVPTTNIAGQLAFDNNAWAASRGALQNYDGTASTYVVATLTSDTPTNGQVPTWNTGGTITWETPSAGGGGNSKWATTTIDSAAIYNVGLGAVGIGTTTPHWGLTSSSSTAPQLTLTDASLTSSPFNLRAIGNHLYLSTSSPTTFATTSNPIIDIDSTGYHAVGIGTTTPFSTLSIAADAGVDPFGVASTTKALMFGINQNTHIVTGGGRPVISACGTTPTIYGNDSNMLVYAGSVLATTCTITFWAPYTNPPVCTIAQQTGTSLALNASTTPTAIVISGGTFTSDRFSLHCEEPFTL